VLWSSHPLVVLAIVWALSLAAKRPRQWSPAAQRRIGPSIVTGAGCAVLLVYFAIVIWYTCQFTYFDPAEPTITAVASVFHDGKALYPAIDAPERYVLIYGPVLFIAQAGAMALFGKGIVVSKALGALAISASLWLGYHVYSKRAGRLAATAATSACALVYLDFGNVTYWTRPDPFLILCAVVALYAATLPGRRGAIVLGVTAGLAVNLKVSGPLYLLPAFALRGTLHGRSGVSLAALTATLVGIAPFLAPTISASHYLQYLQLSAANGLTASRFRQNLEWALFLSAPVGAAVYGMRDRYSWLREQTPFLVGLAASLVMVAVIAAKPGGGPYHFLPIVPFLGYAVVGLPAEVLERGWLRSLVTAVIVSSLALAIPRQALVIATVRGRPLDSALTDVRRFADAHPSSQVAVGYSGTSRVSDARTAIVFRTGEYWLDVPAIQEYRLSGLSLPASTLKRLEECRVDLWLIPAGGEPFLVPSAYRPDALESVFPDEFRAAFHRNYQPTGETQNFTVWECRSRR
jgi:hypothetical protein